MSNRLATAEAAAEEARALAEARTAELALAKAAFEKLKAKAKALQEVAAAHQATKIQRLGETIETERSQEVGLRAHLTDAVAVNMTQASDSERAEVGRVLAAELAKVNNPAVAVGQEAALKDMRELMDAARAEAEAAVASLAEAEARLGAEAEARARLEDEVALRGSAEREDDACMSFCLPFCLLHPFPLTYTYTCTLHTYPPPSHIHPPSPEMKGAQLYIGLDAGTTAPVHSPGTVLLSHSC